MYRIVREIDDYSGFDDSTVSEIKERLGRFLKKAETLIVEDRYIDKDWREEYSLF